MNSTNFLFCFFILLAANAYAQNNSGVYHEQYRPQIHFSPQAHWMNDPNGMIYNNGIYHLFFSIIPVVQFGDRCIGDMQQAQI